MENPKSEEEKKDWNQSVSREQIDGIKRSTNLDAESEQA